MKLFDTTKLSKLILFIVFTIVTHFSFSQEGDITPFNIGRFDNIRTDKSGNIYAYQSMYPSDINFLLKYNGSNWAKIDMDSSGWYYVYNNQIDQNGDLYLYASKTRQETAGIYFFSKGKWEKLPPIFSESKIRNIVINSNNELMAYGQFTDGKKKYYVVTWKNNLWVPFHEKISNKFVLKQFEAGNLNKVRTGQNGNIYILFYNYNSQTKETKNYFVVSNGSEWNLLDTISHNFPETIRDFEVDSKGNLYVAGYYDSKNYCLAKYENNKWNILLQKYSRIECVEIMNNDDVLFAGEFGWGSISVWSQNKETNFASVDGHVNDMTLAGNEIVAIVGIGNKKVYRIKQGEKVTQKKQKEKSEWQKDFFIAVEKWDETAIITALNNGAEINAYNEDGQTALSMVITGKPDDMKKVVFLVEKNADVNIRHRDSWSSILGWAIYKSNIEIVKYLIAKGADVNKLYGFSQTPALHTAINNKNLEMVKIVVEAGADVNAVSIWSKEKRSPLKIAEEMGLTQISDYLKSKGAK